MNRLTEFTSIRSNLVDIGSGLGNKQFELSSLALYPNPTMGSFNISTINKFEKDLTFEILDATGSMVKRFVLSAGEEMLAIDLSKEPNGLYVVRCLEANWNQRLVLRK